MLAVQPNSDVSMSNVVPMGLQGGMVRVRAQPKPPDSRTCYRYDILLWNLSESSRLDRRSAGVVSAYMEQNFKYFNLVLTLL